MLKKENKDEIIAFLRDKLENIKTIAAENQYLEEASMLENALTVIEQLADHALNDTTW